MFHLYTPSKLQKFKGFVTFLGGIQIEHGLKLGCQNFGLSVTSGMKIVSVDLALLNIEAKSGTLTFQKKILFGSMKIL